MPQATTHGITIEYESFGSSQAEPILLVSGLGVQMTRWSVPFCELLAARGYRVIRFDNRDAGLSTHFHEAKVPDIAELAAAGARGERLAVPYTLSDMGRDAVGLMDALKIERAHLVGRSMGGMIAQLVAAEYPGRVLSLTAIMSSTGNPQLPPPSSAAMTALMRSAPNPFEDPHGYAAHSVALAREIGSPGFPLDEAALAAQALADARRAYRPGGLGRQLAAIAASGDIRARLKKIAAPTLVIHGSHDPLIPPECGRDIARNVESAIFMLLDGMGHDLPPQRYASVADAIASNARRQGDSSVDDARTTKKERTERELFSCSIQGDSDDC